MRETIENGASVCPECGGIVVRFWGLRVGILISLLAHRIIFGGGGGDMEASQGLRSLSQQLLCTKLHVCHVDAQKVYIKAPHTNHLDFYRSMHSKRLLVVPFSV